MKSLFAGTDDEPPLATLVYGAAGEPLWKCPHCGMILTEEDTDAIGAEPCCCFCNRCDGEFEM